MNNNLIYILKYFLIKDNYNNYNKYIVIKDNYELTLLYKYLSALYENHADREEFSTEEFCAYVRSQNSDLEEYLDLLSKVVVGNDIVSDIVQEAKHRSEALDVAMLAIDVSEGKKSYEELLTKAKSLDKIDIEDVEFVTTSLDELYDINVKRQGLRWRLKTLNEMLGSIRKGDFGFVFARPETGKTTFLASECAYFLQQVNKPIIWFNNEEDGNKVVIRVFQAMFGVTGGELFANRPKYQELFNKITNNNFKFYDNAAIYKRDVEHLCMRYDPALIIFDQLDKIKGFTSDREDLRLGFIYQWARELAKTYCPVIAISQADGSGEGKQWLTMENVANAKTAKQAEADWILGIGRRNDPGYEYIRHLHLSKNKLTGDEDTIPTLRHGRRDVIIDPDHARYRDITQ